MSYETLSPWIIAANRVLNPFRNYLIPATILRALLGRSQSPLIRETLRAPGAWPAMEIIYDNASPVSYLDRLALRSNPLTIATRNRKRYVVSELTNWIRSASAHGPVTILGVGAGPGRHVQEAIVRSNVAASQIRAILVDRDPSAFELGKRLAREYGIDDAVQFVQGDARDIQHILPGTRFNIVKLIGLIEYLDDRDTYELFSAVRKVMLPQGRLLTHGIADPLSMARFFERVFGLRHYRRSGNEVEALLRRAGFESIEQTSLPLNVFPMMSATATKD